MRTDGGFGLVGMRERLAAAGGTLAVESAPGAGHHDRRLGAGMTTPAADRPLRIVVVDDHPVVRDGLRGMIDGQPDLVVVGRGGRRNEAVAVVVQEHPDVVLMDLRMPRPTG